MHVYDDVLKRSDDSKLDRRQHDHATGLYMNILNGRLNVIADTLS